MTWSIPRTFFYMEIYAYICIMKKPIKKSTPLFKIGDICGFIIEGFEDDPEECQETMEIVGEAKWHEYENHPNGGYWQYEIKGKANKCPEDMLRLKTKKP